MEWKPRKYQLTAYNHVINNLFTGLFLDMGLGKTSVTLNAVSDLLLSGEIRRVLVIAPLRVAKTVWKQEAAKWDGFNWLKVAIACGTAKEREAALRATAHIVVINRENVTWYVDFFLRGKRPDFDALIIDELSSFKAHDTQRFKALKKIRPFFKRIIGLTGTPGIHIGLWAQLYCLDGGKRLEYYISAYRKKYFMEVREGASEFALGWELLPGADLVIQDKISDICIAMEGSDYLELPEMLTIDIRCDMDAKTMSAYKKFEREKITEVQSQEITALSGSALSNKLLQWSNGGMYYDGNGNYVEVHDVKINALLDLIEQANGEPVLVAYSYKFDAKRIYDAVKKQFNFECRPIDTDKDVDDWNAGKIKVALCHPASVGHGLNLQYGGNKIVWFGINPSLELYMQFNKRLHRSGITKPVFVWRILCNNTLDDHFIEILNGKKSAQSAIMEYIKK